MDEAGRIFSPAKFFEGGPIGVLIIHGFTGSPASVLPWAQGLAQSGYTVSVPRLPGHGTTLKDCNQTNYEDWYLEVEKNFLELKSKCAKVFVAGFSVGGALALRLEQLRPNEIAGLILLNASIFDESKKLLLTPLLSLIKETASKSPTDVAKPNPPTHSYDRTPLKAFNSVRQLWKLVENDLILVQAPALLAYSLNDHRVHPICSETIINNIQSNLREVVFEKSFHNVPLDYDNDALVEESIEFIEDVIAGEFSHFHDDRELIDSEFESIVAGLSLDESAPTTYLDELERFEELEKFNPPNPRLSKPKKETRISGWMLAIAIVYLVVVQLAHLDLFGVGIWPGVILFCSCIGMLIYGQIKHHNDDPGEFGDGSHL